MDFKALWEQYGAGVTRYVRFRIADVHDAEDVLQEIMTAACTSVPGRNPQAWLIGLAKNKVADHFRRRGARRDEPVYPLPERAVHPCFTREPSDVADTLLRLPPQDQQLLRMVYWHGMEQAAVAQALHVPLGTVKSRLHAARERFRVLYPHPPKGASTMKKMPLVCPEYTIEPLSAPPFPVVWEEVMGWFIVPREGETLTWAMYDDPDGVRTEVDSLTVTGKAMVHGLIGVEIQVETQCAMAANQIDGCQEVTRSFVAQLTDTHCRILSETHTQGGIKCLYTYLDEEFMQNWGFGEGNCGNETHLTAKGDIRREGSIITSSNQRFLLDIVGRYRVTIGGKCYDTICVMDLESYGEGIVTEQYLDERGRTILWRRFNADTWHGGEPWTDRLPHSQRLTINGQTFVHWYDCVTSYIL